MLLLPDSCKRLMSRKHQQKQLTSLVRKLHMTARTTTLDTRGMRGNGETPSSLGSSQGAHHQHQYQGVISQVTCGSSCIFAAIIGGN